ncbi:MAG: PilZ domain-containing protein [Planctomycetota bacterium]
MSVDAAPSWGPQLTVRLRMDDGRFLEGQVSAISSDSLSARFDPTSELALPLGRRVPLVLIGSGPQTVHEARVMQRSTHDGWLEYTFQAAGTGSFTTSGGRNRRAAYRVEIPGKSPIPVVLSPYSKEDTFEPIEAQIADVSRLGLGIAVPDDSEDTLFACHNVRLAFTLPGDLEPFHFVGFVRQRRFQGVFLRYGVEFQGGLTERHGEQEERVNRYVMRRQIELIRRTNRWLRVG